MKHTINIRKIALYIYAFILLYMPNMSHYLKVNSIILLMIPTALYLFKFLIKKDSDFFNIFLKKGIFLFIALNILFTIYFAFRTAIAGVSITDIYNLRIIQNLFPLVILAGVCIVYHELTSMHQTKIQMYKFIINVALIQSAISCSMIIFPSLRNIAYNIFYSDGDAVNIYINASRLYGICDGDYTYGLQILQSYIALFSLYFGYFYQEKKYYLYSLFVLLTTMLNGRFGIIIYIIGVMYLFFHIMFVEKKFKTSMRYIATSIVSCVLILCIFKFFVPNTFNILVHAKNDIISFLKEENSSTETYSLVNSLTIPDSTKDVIFGAGYRIYAKNGHNFGDYRSSDIGFVNDIFMAGAFSSLMYISYLQLIKKINKRDPKKDNKFERTITFILIVCVILANIKGEVFRSLMQISSILFILIFILLGENENDKEKILNNNSSL